MQKGTRSMNAMLRIGGTRHALASRESIPMR